MPYKTLNSNKVTLKHTASFIIRFGAHNHRLFRYTIEMEERTKIAYDLDESEYKSWKSCVFALAKRVKIISAYKTKNTSSTFFANRNNSS